LILGALFIGAAAGLLSGLFGIGGGIIIVPALVYLLKFDQQKAIGTSLAALLLPVGILAVWKYARLGHVDFRVAFTMSASLFVMALIGSLIGLGVGNTWLTRGFGLLLVGVGIKFMIFTR
jgi:uncharacterized membrane protein YfcA